MAMAAEGESTVATNYFGIASYLPFGVGFGSLQEPTSCTLPLPASKRLYILDVDGKRVMRAILLT